MREEGTALDLIVSSLERVEGKLDRGLSALAGKLDGKADKADLARIEGELSGHGRRITALEREEDLRQARSQVHSERDRRSFFARKQFWAWVAGVSTTLATVTLAVVAVIQTAHF